MEITEKTITERWAPPVMVGSRHPRFMQQAEIYKHVYDQIMKLEQNTDVHFFVWIDDDRPTKLIIKIGFQKSWVFTEDRSLLLTFKGGWIPDIADEIAQYCAEYLTTRS